MNGDTVTGDAAAEAQRLIFLKSVPLQIRLQEIRRVIGDTDRLACLDFGNDNGAFSLYLRRSGGTWTTVVREPAVAAGASALLEATVTVFEGDELDVPDKHFDLVVVGEGLERSADGQRFIAMCHRILKPDGRMLVCVPRDKPVSVLNPLRRRLARGARPPHGYTEGELFRTLKDGFDVHLMRSYSRFFVELTDILTGPLRAAGAAAGAVDERLRRQLMVAYILGWIGYQLDVLLFFTRGCRLIALGQRRPWLPRKTPVLGDGRSITEAVLQTASR